MTQEEIKTKIQRFRYRATNHLLHNRPISAKMETNVADELKKHLTYEQD